ncbi:FkbH like protein [Streptomyces davaonensis JCM 4913]|uniref:FkbH like protein n=1 Tax=Streptomyces davaonensis (strain DSM 101723 / JCM 4913 / KCC S-0913 / 768) TaxID=1214101 RepID=K4QZD7_STRDJ|nr:HAD-IIIC family phosphatase [Streptomyces davaonensis]CCK25744.1 FkbH like protein [Streptomyces davaonensis JCM 4913]
MTQAQERIPLSPASWHDQASLAALRGLYRAGRLAEEYGTVRALLSRMPRADLPAAGQLLARLDLEEVRRHAPDLPVVSIAVTGESTVAPVVGPLTAELARHGLLLEAKVAPYGSYVQDLMRPADPAMGEEQPHLTLCVLDAHTVVGGLTAPWRAEDVEKAARTQLALLTAAVGAHQQAGRGLLVLNTVPLHHHFTHQLIDLRCRARLGVVWRQFNSGLLSLAAEHPGVVVIDLDPLIGEGVPAAEPRAAQYARARLSEPLLARYARESAHIVRARLGRTRKVLVLDLDGTLWGGVLGEDGPGGIELGVGLRGEAFAEFQRVLRQLAAQGVLLAVSSKNDADAVSRTLRTHPAMVLREQDFVHVNANWKPKHDNLRDIAERLGLGLDSFVFADDSLFECGLVAEQLPEVAVVRVDDEPALHPSALLADGWFDLFELTEADLERADRYRTEARRQEFREDFDSYQDYLDGLGLEVTLRPPDEPDLARVSQLTLRTNQFHLATERLHVPQVADRMTYPGQYVIAVHARDRFGDHGLVGALFLRRDGKVLRIDNFALSCRVFARGIEAACVAAVLRFAHDSGAQAVAGRYLPSPRNAAFAAFYGEQGFTPVGTDPDDPDAVFFRHDLRHIAPAPAHLRLHAAFGPDTGDRT